jgi:capsule polysaccharide export protein KpsE/RkpR
MGFSRWLIGWPIKNPKSVAAIQVATNNVKEHQMTLRELLKQQAEAATARVSNAQAELAAIEAKLAGMEASIPQFLSQEVSTVESFFASVASHFGYHKQGLVGGLQGNQLAAQATQIQNPQAANQAANQAVQQ